MSVNVSWDSSSTPVTLVRPGQRMADGQCVIGWGLAIGDGLGDLLVIEGTPEELLGLAKRILGAVSDSDTSHLAGRSTRARDRVWELTPLRASSPPLVSNHHPPKETNMRPIRESEVCLRLKVWRK